MQNTKPNQNQNHARTDKADDMTKDQGRDKSGKRSEKDKDGCGCA